MRFQGPCQLRQHLCVLRTVVDVPDQAVLKRHLSACLVKIVTPRLHQLRDRIVIGNRHDLFALFIRDRVQGEGQRDGEFLVRKVIDPGHDPASRDRHISLTDVESVLIGEKAQEADQIVVVVQRLTRPHHHNVGHPLAGHTLDLIDLVQHLGRRQRADQSIQRRRAEPAAHAAAHLGGDAYAVAKLVAHENALHKGIVRHGKQILLRAVQLRDLSVDHPHGCERILA